jgi:hypothetical protein
MCSECLRQAKATWYLAADCRVHKMDERETTVHCQDAPVLITFSKKIVSGFSS